jgi:hypothetical protein
MVLRLAQIDVPAGWAHVVVTYDATLYSNEPVVYFNGASVAVGGSRSGLFRDLGGHRFDMPLQALCSNRLFTYARLPPS